MGRAGRIRSKESPILVVPGLVSAGQPGGYREFLFPARSSDHCVVWGDKGVDYCFVGREGRPAVCSAPAGSLLTLPLVKQAT